MEFITENGRAVNRIGQGTWYLGENAATAARPKPSFTEWEAKLICAWFTGFITQPSFQ